MKNHSTFIIHNSALIIDSYRKEASFFDYQEKNLERKSIGQLVLLGFDVTAFTPVAYQRGSLPQPLREFLSWG
jgi:hypothetical protein